MTKATLAEDGRSRRARTRREQRRETIMRAGERTFGTRGYNGTSVADVLEAAGIARGTFYLYFDGKVALFQALVDRFIARVMGEVRRVDPSDREEAIGQIQENIRRVVDLLLNHRWLTSLALRDAVGLDKITEEKLKRLHEFLQVMVAGALRNGAEMGLIRPVNEEVVGPALIGAIKEVMLQHVARGPRVAADREAIADDLYQFAMRGLQA